MLVTEDKKEDGSGNTMIRFCPKCHRQAFQLVKSKEGTQVIQNGQTLINLGNNSGASISISCPQGHPIKLEIVKEPIAASQTLLEVNYGNAR